MGFGSRFASDGWEQQIAPKAICCSSIASSPSQLALAGGLTLSQYQDYKLHTVAVQLQEHLKSARGERQKALENLEKG